MNAALTVAVLWIAFGASHMILSSVALRPRLVGILGERAFQGLYSLIALAIFVPLVTVYFRSRGEGAALWYLGAAPGVRWLAYVLMGVAFALLVAGLVRPSPASVSPGRPEPAGVLRVTRHPVLMAIGLYGVAHLLVAPIATVDLAFFAGFPLFTLVGARHQDLRKLATSGDAFRRFHASTAFLPFSRPAEALTGIREDAVAIAIGVAAAWGIRVFHTPLFGA